MKKAHEIFVGKIKLGKKGQITLPKKIRDEDGFKEGDVLKFTHIPGGGTMLERAPASGPDVDLFEFLKSLPPFDAEKAWKEVLEERRKSDR